MSCAHVMRYVMVSCICHVVQVYDYMSCDMSLKFLICHGDHMSCRYVMVAYVMVICHGVFFFTDVQPEAASFGDAVSKDPGVWKIVRTARLV